METETQSKTYWPLVCLILVALLAGSAITYGVKGGSLQWMHYFMGILLCLFSLLKFFDVRGFADGFQMYDLVAKKSRAYALSYPLIELLLGLAYLAFFYPPATYLVTVVVMVTGSLGVIKTLRQGLNIHCACMGTVLRVPLSTVTLTEDLGMGALAFLMLAFHFW